MLIKILYVMLPVCLFIYKYIIFACAKEGPASVVIERMKREAMHFSVDLLYIAGSYSATELIYTISSIVQNKRFETEDIELIVYITCLLLLIVIMMPIMILLTEKVEAGFDAKCKYWPFILMILCYVVSIVLIKYTIFVF